MRCRPIPQPTPRPQGPECQGSPPQFSSLRIRTGLPGSDFLIQQEDGTGKCATNPQSLCPAVRVMLAAYARATSVRHRSNAVRTSRIIANNQVNIVVRACNPARRLQNGRVGNRLPSGSRHERPPDAHGWLHSCSLAHDQCQLGTVAESAAVCMPDQGA